MGTYSIINLYIQKWVKKPQIAPLKEIDLYVFHLCITVVHLFITREGLGRGLSAVMRP
jgi:hypothetical protein